MRDKVKSSNTTLQSSTKPYVITLVAGKSKPATRCQDHNCKIRALGFERHKNSHLKNLG